MNVVVLVGNLTRDPEIKHLPSGTVVTNYTLAVNNPFKRDEEGKTTADFINIVTFGKQAENIGKYMKKGCKMAVEGRLQTRTWEDQNGNRRYAVEVITNQVDFLTFPDNISDQTNNSDNNEDIVNNDELPF